MAAQSLTDEALQEAVEAVARLGSQSAAADYLRMSRTTFQHRVREAERRGFRPDGQRMVMKGQSVLYDGDGNERGRWDKTRLAGRAEGDYSAVGD
jgi:DNA-binding transcriptional MocR family regulator